MVVERSREGPKQEELTPEGSRPGESHRAVTRRPAQEFGLLPPADLDDFYGGDDEDVVYWGLFDD